MAGSAQNPPSSDHGDGLGTVPLGPSSRSSSRSLWFVVALALLATFSAAVAAVAVARERTTQRQLASMNEGLELLRLERDVSVVASRLLVTTTMHMYAGGLEAEVETAKRAFRASLVTAGDALAADRPSVAWQPIHDQMREAVGSALATFEDPRSDSELLSWTDEFLYDYKRVIPTDNLGEWTHVLEVSTWVQEASLVPRGYLDQAMARLWELEGRAPVDTSLIDQLQYTLASLRHIADSHGAKATSYTPFEEYLVTESAEVAGPEFAVMVRGLKSRAGVRRIEADMPFMLGLTETRSFETVEGVYGQIDPYARDLETEAEQVRVRAVQLLNGAVVASQRRHLTAWLGGAVAIALILVLSVRLVQRRRLVERQLRLAAEKDALTGLGNRYALFARAPGLLADPSNGGFALIHLDMDDFKSINDQFGHHVGDAALIAFADACRASVRSESDSIVRMGGDEFVIVLFGLEDPIVEARAVVSRLRLRLENPIEAAGYRLMLPASAGLAISADPMPLQELLVQSDLALLEAKERGRNESQLFRSGLRRTLVRELESAMTRGELRCAFQPQIDLETGAVVGLEGLMRWRRPDQEIEALKLVDAVLWLGKSLRWLEEAMLDVQDVWATLGDSFEGRLWLNLTGRDVEQARAEELLDILGGTSVPTERLGVELTEPVLRADLGDAVAMLSELREAGIAVALDDVGNDRIPLLHVTELPIDVVKLDRELVSKIDARPERRHIVESIVGLCDRLSLRLVGEGVETPAEEAVLRALGIRYVQGFRFAKALFLDELTALVEERARSEGTSAEDVA